jgi:hypothetical protein
MTEQIVTTRISEECCITCGCVFYIPSVLQARRKETHEIIFCPTGHEQHYTGKTEAQKLKEALEAKQRELDAQAKALINVRGDLYKANDDKSKMARKLDRLKNGVCSECHRTFENLQRHMNTKHSHKAK